MKTNKSDTIRLRIHPDKKAALEAVAKEQQLDISKLVMAQIEKLINQEPLNLSTEGEEQGEETNPLTMRLSFRPLPGDEQRLNRYAAARSIKPSVVMKLVLRAWLSHNAPMPKNELALLGITSNQIAAIGRSLNQLVKLAHAGSYPLPDELTALLQETLILTRQASQEIDNIVKTNLSSWESDHA
ncbi:MAG: hypothetical protein WAW61_02450 [Methylococcaceae bacterium]